MTWHLALSRGHVPSGVRRIASPRHFIIYRVVGKQIYILRLLHDATNLTEQHLP